MSIVLYSGASFAQNTIPAKTDVPVNNIEQQLENNTAANEDESTEDDMWLQEMAYFIKHPININNASGDDLKKLQVLSPIQIQSFTNYRKLLGSFISIYEIQAIPFWDIETIQKIKPYITIHKDEQFLASLAQRLKGGDHTLLLRISQAMQKSKGYLIDTALSANYYTGSPQKILIRYKYRYKDLLQYGITAEKDAGEQFFKGGQKQGFDFYSAHFFIRKNGFIKNLAMGDYVVNMGQGLTQWMSLAFKKGADITMMKREADVLRPYNAAGEIFFHRGAGITVGKKNWSATAFVSYRKLDGNYVSDTLVQDNEYITSLQTSGLHRTAAEIADKNIQRQIAFGANTKFVFKNLNVSFNAVKYQFRVPISKQQEPYNLYAISGRQLGNYSFDYGYTFKNFHLFGEAAINNKKFPAFINGILVSVANTVDVSMLYRNISKGYQSLYANAFTEGSYPNNEKGLFTGITVRLSPAWRVDAYADVFQFPWLKYRVNAPSSGKEYLAQLTYWPIRQLEIYSRFRFESKAINMGGDTLVLKGITAIPKQNWRSQVNFKISKAITLRNRLELVWYDGKGPQQSEGFLFYADFLYKPMLRPYAGSIRLQYFETDDYNSRIYAYENDVLYSYAIPVVYGKGYRMYLNLNYDVSKNCTIWLRFAHTRYPERLSIGSGLDEIRGNKKTDLTFQVLLNR